MEIRVASPEELASVVHHRATTGSIDIAVAPGRYEYVGCRVPSADDPYDDLTVRAGDPDDPPVFTGVALALSAHRVTVEGIVFRGALGRNPIIDLCASESIAIRCCSVIENACDDWPPREPLMRLTPAAGPRGASAEISQCWMLGNRERSPSAMLSVGVAPPGRFRHLRFVDVGMIGNHFTHLVDPAATHLLEFEACVLTTLTGDRDGIVPANSYTSVSLRNTQVIDLPTDRDAVLQGELVAWALRRDHPDARRIEQALGL